MTHHTSARLSGGLRAWSESFFRMELGDVAIHRGLHTREYDAAAFALGSNIYLPERGQLGPDHELELLGHELTHVVQQRQGRVRPSGYLGGYPVNTDPDLEREAMEMGQRFAHGGESTLPRLPISTARVPVVQRALTVAGKPLSDESELSPGAAAVLGLMDGGGAWLAWAIKNSGINYHFADERRLIVGIQSGSHGTDLMLLSGLGLLVHPYRLLDMDVDDLKVVSAAESETDPNSVVQLQAKKILAKDRLLTQSELAIGTEFLAQTGVASAPVFQALALADRIALFNLVDGALTEISQTPMIQKEAAQFAVEHAQCPREFVDYYQFYVASVDDAKPAPKGASSRSRKAEVSLDTLGPLLHGMLFCPAVQGVPTAEGMNTIVQNWVSQGNNLGFARLSLALAQVAQFANLQGATGEAASKTIAQYMDQAEKYILQRPAGTITPSQDASEYAYVYDSQPSRAEVCLAANGNVTLATYQSKT